jgi:hypothetical protein
MGEYDMAAAQKPPDDRPSALQQHPLVDALRPDPTQPPADVAVLQGFLGKSPTEGVWRLYLTPALDEYVEIPESDIVHAQDLPDGGGTIVWVPKSLSLPHTRTQSQQVQADFLSGAIAARALPSAASPAGQVTPTIMHPTTTVIPSIGIVCPTPTATPSVHVICPTPPVSVHILCPTPSAVHACGHVTLPLCPTETIPPTHLIRCPHSVVTPCVPVTLPFCPTETCPPSRLVICPQTIVAPCLPVSAVCPTVNPAICPIASGAACPPVSLGCPQGGPQQGGPQQGQSG